MGEKQNDFLARVRLKVRLWQKRCYNNVLWLCVGVEICVLVRVRVCVNLSQGREGTVISAGKGASSAAGGFEGENEI